MKQKQIIILSVVVITIIGVLVWFKNPIDTTTINPEEITEIAKFDLIPMVMVKGELYLDTGKESDFNRTCGTMDGEITSTVEPFEKPDKDNQSNFGKGYGYQFVSPNSIDVLINEKWIRFEKESKDVTDENYERISEYMKEHSIDAFSPYYELLDFQISNYAENSTDEGMEATFYYKIIEKNYDKDPDTVGYIREAKESGSKNYQQMYDEYLEPREMNFDFKIIIDKEDKITLYSNVSPNGVQWEETKMTDYILQYDKEIETKDSNEHNIEPFIYSDTEIDEFWDNLVSIPGEYTGFDIYWRHIDKDTMEKTDNLIEKYGVEVLFKGLESKNVYSQYYCVNRLVEYYNNDDIRIDAISKITPFLTSTNNTLKHGAEFAINVLDKKFDSPYVVKGIDDIKVFALFNDYSDYGSYNELWMIKNDKLSKLYSFKDPQMYIDITEPIKLSPDNSKIAVQTSSRRSSSLNIIDLNTGESSPEIMKMAIEKVAMDNKEYNNTYPDGQYSWCGNLKWIDNNMVEFEASLAYDYMEIIEQVIVKYNVLDNFLEYTKK